MAHKLLKYARRETPSKYSNKKREVSAQEIETALLLFLFMFFPPPPANNKDIKTIKTKKGEVVVKHTHLDLSVKCGSTPTRPRKGKKEGRWGTVFNFPLALYVIIQNFCTGSLKMFFVCFESALCSVLILLDSFVDVELERKGALLCMRLRLILFLSHCFVQGGRSGGVFFFEKFFHFFTFSAKYYSAAPYYGGAILRGA